MTTKTFTVPTIHCGHCTMTIERELKDLPGVREVKATLDNRNVTVTWELPASWEKIEALLTEIGYAPA